GELGTRYNTGTVRASFELPEQGIVLSAEGKFLGDTSTYLVELKKRMGDSSDIGVNYGSRHVGLNKRLTIGLNSTFTLGELWRSVVGRTGEDLLGGRTLAEFNKDLVDFFQREGVKDSLVAELRRVYEGDVGRKILSLEAGRLTREIEELRKAGALLDNVVTRGFVGFVSNAVGTDTADRAAGGGFQVGTQTELTLTQSQRELVSKRVASLYASGLLLQTRLLDLTQRWQAAVAEILQARWERDLALYMAANANDRTLAADGEAKVVAAQARLHQARLRYNMLTGRPPEAAFPFEAASPRDMDRLLITLGEALAQPKPLSELFGRLSPGSIVLPEESFNLLDWIPWIEKMTLWVGVQFKDVLANQVLGGGLSIRLPIYDPFSENRDKALSLEADSILLEMYETYQETRLRAASEKREAEGYDGQIALLAPESPVAARAVKDAIRQYRNNLISQSELWSAMRRWYWTMSRLLDARVRAALKDAWARMDEEQADSQFKPIRRNTGSGTVVDLNRALDVVESGSAGLAGLAKRSQAAAQLLEAADRRIEKVAVDINIGVNVTATGIALLPALGVTGFGIFPIVSIRMKPEDLRVLEKSRRGAEVRLANHMGVSLAGDLALQFFSAYSAYEASAESIAIYERQPDGLDRNLTLAALRAHQNQLRAAINHMLNRDFDAPLTLTLSADDALAQFVARAKRTDVLASRLAALSERVRVARAVEEIVDKNLKVDEIRIEPVSLIGRSLGRLVAALSGSGDASPELVARARHATLSAEREFLEFNARLNARRSSLHFERSEALRSLETTRDPGQLVLLKNRLRLIDAGLAMLGEEPDSDTKGRVIETPQSFAALRNSLVAAFRSREPIPGLSEAGGFSPGPSMITAVGALRYFHSRISIGSDPIDKSFIEGWVEVRLESRTTPPEALLALAALQRERADQIHSAAMARAESRALVVLGRMRLRAALLRWARTRGTRGANFAAELEKGMRRDLDQIGAMLGTKITLDEFLAIVPIEEGNSPETAARALTLRIDETNLNAMRSTLFPEGLPDGMDAPNASLQLRANLIAERMSYKGFTPVGTFGHFRDKWVSGVFLQAPDPARIQRGLEGILSDALRQELESRDRLKTLSLRLHALMVSVSDGARLIEARIKRLDAARRNLEATLVLFERGSAGAQDAAASEGEVSVAWTELIETYASVRMDFIRLVTEMEALGMRASKGARPRQRRREKIAKEDGVVSSLADFLSRRMMDADFAARLDALFDGTGLVSKETRERLLFLAGEYRLMSSNAELVRHHPAFTPKERLALLTKADVEGRRRLLSAEFARLLQPLAEGPGKGRATFHRFLVEELAARGKQADSVLASERALLDRMAGSIFKRESAEVRAVARKLIDIRRRSKAARDDLFKSYLERGNRPEDFVLKDRALDAYLRVLAEYDREVLLAFESHTDREALLLNMIFSLRESAERRRRLLKNGRGLLAADVMIAIEEARLDAAAWRRSAPHVRLAAAARLSHLRGLRERWLADPTSMPALVAEVDADGKVERWLTEADLAGLQRAERIVEVNGARWVLPPSHAGQKTDDPAALGARKIVEGADAEQDLRDGETVKRESIARRVQVDRVLAAEPFARVGLDGESRGGLTLEKLRKLERQGRVLYFRKNKDRRSGLRTALHPVEARMADPNSIVTYIIDEDAPAVAGRYGSLEALLGSNETAAVSRLETGRTGYVQLAREAEAQASEAQRSGWISLKLESYAFALDEYGNITGVYMNAEELETARKKTPELVRSFHLASAIQWGIAPGGQLAEVRVAGITRTWRFSGSPETWIEGSVSAVLLHEDGAIARVLNTDKELKKAARGWIFEDMSGRMWEPGSEIDPIHRLRRYIDPKTRLPVLLGRSILERRRTQAAEELDDKEGWATKPSNWPNIVLELPRGIVQTPIEIITGRDLNQHHFIGRVYMYRGEGGATVRRGTFGKIIHFIDFLDILPDKVDRYLDPSQFPDRVRTDGSILPGEWIYERDPRTDDRNIHFGIGGLTRAVRSAAEDIEDARGRILQSFRGGVRETFLETVRGRGGLYPNARVRHRQGGSAIRGVLKDAGGAIDRDGDGNLDARPGSIEVDRVRADLQVRIGAEQHAERARAYRELIKTFPALQAAVMMAALPFPVPF
ncbi:MAG: hypothetical protein COB53_12390, partial [Elusimicrobia bacterium]